MSQKFVIDGRLMGLNEYVNRNRASARKGNRAKREQTELVAAYVRRARLKPMDGPIEVGVCWVEGKARNGLVRDEDNILVGLKFILDALVECGIIPDDNPRVVRNIYNTFVFNSDDPHIEVALMEYQPSGRTVFFKPIRGLDEEEHGTDED